MQSGIPFIVLSLIVINPIKSGLLIKTLRSSSNATVFISLIPKTALDPFTKMPIFHLVPLSPLWTIAGTFKLKNGSGHSQPSKDYTGASKSSGFLKASNSLNEKPESCKFSSSFQSSKSILVSTSSTTLSTQMCRRPWLHHHLYQKHMGPDPSYQLSFLKLICLSSLFAISGQYNEIGMDTWHAKLWKSS